MPGTEEKKEWVLEDKVMPHTRCNITPHFFTRRSQEKVPCGSIVRVLNDVVVVQLPAVILFSLDTMTIATGEWLRVRAPSRRDRNKTIRAP